MDKPIEETHPTLMKNKGVFWNMEVKRNITAEDNWVSEDYPGKIFLTFQMEDIQKHTIDKAVLRDKLLAKCESSGSLIVHNIVDLLRYLELEEK